VDVEKLRRILGGLRWQPSPRELAEVIWLAGHLPAAGPVDAGPPGPGAADPLPERVADERPSAAPVTSPASARAPVHVPAEPAEDGPEHQAARPVQAPHLPLLPQTLDLLRALRPLKRLVPAAHRSEMDEEATVTWYAERRRWLPVLRPGPARALDLALVIDTTSASAAAWSGLGQELATLFTQLGAFQDIRIRYLITGRDGGLRLATTDDPAATAREPAELAYPRTRRIILVLSDCVGDRWASPQAHAILARWARSCAVAILQPLPEHLWSRTSLPPVTGILRGGGGLAEPNSTLSFAPRYPTAESDPVLPVPVLEISPEWLRPWVRLVTGTAPHGVDAVAALVDGPSTSLIPRPPADLTPFERVLRFRAEATPEAYRLAGLLSAAVLTPSTMRLVQAALLPRSRPEHLAEVWFSGLLVPDSTSGVESRYEFVDGVRHVLLGTLRRHEMYRVLDEVSQLVDQRMNRVGATFTAGTPDRDGPLRISPLSRPFARIQSLALDRFRTATGDVTTVLPPAAASTPAAAVGAEPDPGASPASAPAAAGRWGGFGGGPPRLDGPGSQVVLLTGRTDSPPELDALRDAMNLVGVPATNIVVPVSRRTHVVAAIRRAVAAGPELVFIYYGGQAVPDADPARLALGEPGTGSASTLSVTDMIEALTTGDPPATVIILDLDAGVDLPDVAIPPGAKISLLAAAGNPPTALRSLATMLRQGDPQAGHNVTLGDLVVRLRADNLLAGHRIVPVHMSLILSRNRAFDRESVRKIRVDSTINSAKIFVCGGFGTGVTTLIDSVSEISPVTTEAVMTSAGVGVDDTRQVPRKTTTTVALDFGRLTIDAELVLYLFGVPGQTRFWFLWDDLVRGSTGAVLVVDTWRLADCFAAVDFLENRRVPYVLAVNSFDGRQYHDLGDVRDALAIPPDVPVVAFDARNRASIKQVLISLLEYIVRGRRPAIRPADTR
jgi:signal recognition particle receptor subunit beta